MKNRCCSIGRNISLWSPTFSKPITYRRKFRKTKSYQFFLNDWIVFFLSITDIFFLATVKTIAAAAIVQLEPKNYNNTVQKTKIIINLEKRSYWYSLLVTAHAQGITIHNFFKQWASVRKMHLPFHIRFEPGCRRRLLKLTFRLRNVGRAEIIPSPLNSVWTTKARACWTTKE